ncbi:hypothetical protein DFQ28_010767 [Apophysomyces sp. BC1034]|nr:hypothetical protein DFQ30_010294 [Apophysomyces sp. BC1015]KAG0168476.1 hypothetical protein DFQ29_010139 [Apophysomyces sp. BC1021]KAG0184657.1 hypothetical protein DFQ28_010767 [Apophysomyces sp. BC1034]
MGLDQTNLHVMMQSGTEEEKKNAGSVLRLLDHGKHWVLVTLLLANVIVNETLPIILDSVIGGGWQAILISTLLIVIFGEMVLMLMYFMYPIAYPTALLLDYFLGSSTGTVYKKAGLKTLVSLHQSQDNEGLTEDEVNIISSVLDLREKPVSKVMVPIMDVFTLSIDSILDKQTVDKILSAGYSRIPICDTDNKSNYIGMLLVKNLITYDSDDQLPVKSFQLRPLPEAAPDTSCLDILNFFQEGRSHMALVSGNPGGSGGAIGVITLEDIIEELIGEEIVDETDVYVDGKKYLLFKTKNLRRWPVHNKIRVTRGRAHPPPPQLRPILQIVRSSSSHAVPRQQQLQLPSSPLPQRAAQLKVPNESTKPVGIERNIRGYGAIMDNGATESDVLASSDPAK